MTYPGMLLRAQWIGEMEEFLQMVLAASQGLKGVCGGKLDWDDEAAYDEEASGCGAALSVLKALAVPPEATHEAARALAREALQNRSTSFKGCAATPFKWALAVVEGDASRYWVAYHPRRSQ